MDNSTQVLASWHSIRVHLRIYEQQTMCKPVIDAESGRPKMDTPQLGSAPAFPLKPEHAIDTVLVSRGAVHTQVKKKKNKQRKKKKA